MSAPTSRLIVPGLVSVVLLNYKGADDTIACLDSLRKLDWNTDRLEIVCVDNASADDSIERISHAFPEIRVIDSGSNRGFAGGCNFGADLAKGEYLAFINNDARPDPAWLSAAVEEFESDRTLASVASKVLDWDGELIDFVDGSLTWYGMGYKPGTAQPDTGEFDQPKDVLFGTGSAVLFRAEIFHAVGGFDERFFMFFEDVDWGGDSMCLAIASVTSPVRWCSIGTMPRSTSTAASGRAICWNATRFCRCSRTTMTKR